VLLRITEVAFAAATYASSPSSSATRPGTRLLQSLRRFAAALPPLLHDLRRHPTGALLLAGRHPRRALESSWCLSTHGTDTALGMRARLSLPGHCDSDKVP
jgi:hypothetical protein